MIDPGRYIVWQYGTRDPSYPRDCPRFAIGDLVTVTDGDVDPDGEVRATGDNGLEAYVLASALGELPEGYGQEQASAVEEDGKDKLPDYGDLPLAYALGLVRYMTENTPR